MGARREADEMSRIQMNLGTTSIQLPFEESKTDSMARPKAANEDKERLNAPTPSRPIGIKATALVRAKTVRTLYRSTWKFGPALSHQLKIAEESNNLADLEDAILLLDLTIERFHEAAHDLANRAAAHRRITTRQFRE